MVFIFLFCPALWGLGGITKIGENGLKISLKRQYDAPNSVYNYNSTGGYFIIRIIAQNFLSEH
jgi:hypothetical protein